MELAEELDLDLRVINPSGVLGGSFSPYTINRYYWRCHEREISCSAKIPLAFVHVDDVATAHINAYERRSKWQIRSSPYQDGIYTMLKRAKKLYPKMKFKTRNSFGFTISSPARLVHGLVYWQEAHTFRCEIILFGDSKYSSKKRKKN